MLEHLFANSSCPTNNPCRYGFEGTMEKHSHLFHDDSMTFSTVFSCSLPHSLFCLAAIRLLFSCGFPTLFFSSKKGIHFNFRISEPKTTKNDEIQSKTDDETTFPRCLPPPPSFYRIPIIPVPSLSYAKPYPAPTYFCMIRNNSNKFNVGKCFGYAY